MDNRTRRFLSFDRTDNQPAPKPDCVKEVLGNGKSNISQSAPEVMTVKEVAGILRCSKAHLSNLMNGKVSRLPPLPHISLGRRKLVRRAALERWLERLEEMGEGC
jgi:hypothetical protein